MRTLLKVSVGVPVFNGEKYLKTSLDSLVKQTYKNLEIIISDNGSTDKTKDICEQFAKCYENIHYYRCEKNRGLAWNHNNTFYLSTGGYFFWFSYDDILHEEYIEKCVDIYTKYSGISVVYSKIKIIDKLGYTIPMKENALDLFACNIYNRFKLCLSPMQYYHSIHYGIIKRDILSKIKLLDDSLGADRCFVARLSLMGKIYQIPEYLFFRRRHENNFGTIHKEMTVYRPGEKNNFVFTKWKLFYEDFKTIFQTDQPIFVKTGLFFTILNWWLKNRKIFIREIIKNSKIVINRLIYFIRRIIKAKVER